MIIYRVTIFFMLWAIVAAILLLGLVAFLLDGLRDMPNKSAAAEPQNAQQASPASTPVSGAFCAAPTLSPH